MQGFHASPHFSWERGKKKEIGPLNNVPSTGKKESCAPLARKEKKRKEEED